MDLGLFLYFQRFSAPFKYGNIGNNMEKVFTNAIANDLKPPFLLMDLLTKERRDVCPDALFRVPVFCA